MHTPKHRIAVLMFAFMLLFHPQSIIAFHPQSTAQKELTLTVLASDALADRIFAREQQTIALFAKHKPIVETYIQSLNPDLQPEGIIDDAYFLSRVSLDPDSFNHPDVQTLAFGSSDKSRRIKMNHGGHWPVYPDGYVAMLFVNISTFDRDRYSLKYAGREQLGNTVCLRFSVTPLSTNPGQFVGNIWVEAADLHIVRIQGTFTPPGGLVLSKNISMWAASLQSDSSSISTAGARKSLRASGYHRTLTSTKSARGHRKVSQPVFIFAEIPGCGVTAPVILVKLRILRPGTAIPTLSFRARA